MENMDTREDKVETDISKIGYESVDWIELAPDRISYLGRVRATRLSSWGRRRNLLIL
jgi:hypothetical protein